jgi:hypothetical protein
MVRLGVRLPKGFLQVAILSGQARPWTGIDRFTSEYHH